MYHTCIISVSFTDRILMAALTSSLQGGLAHHEILDPISVTGDRWSPLLHAEMYTFYDFYGMFKKLDMCNVYVSLMAWYDWYDWYV